MTENDKTTEEGNKSPSPFPSHIEIQFERRIEDSYRSSQNRQERRDRWKVALEALTLIAVVVYATLTWFMWGEMRTATDIARTNFIRDQRPYLWLSDITDPEIIIGQRIIWNLEYSNFGKSPAIGMRIRSQIVFGKNGEKQIAPQVFARIHPPGDTTSGSIVQPGDKTHYTTVVSEQVVSPADYAFIMANDRALILLVHFEYFDTVGHEYHSEMCRSRLQTGAISNCREHNRIY